MAPRLSIELAHEGPFHEGTPIEGHLVVTADDAARIDGGHVRLFAQTTGWGDRGKTDPALVPLAPIEIEPGRTEIPFALTCPEGPVSAVGELVGVEWLLEARLDVPWAIDPKAERTVEVVAPPAAPRELGEGGSYREAPRSLRTAPPAEGTSGARAKLGLGAGALFCLFIGAQVLSSSGDRGQELPLLMLAVAAVYTFARFGLPLVRNRAARSKLGEPHIHVPAEAKRGEPLTVEVELSPRADVTVREVVVTLRCTEHAARGSGKNRRSKSREALSERRVLASEEAVAAGGSRTFSERLEVPLGSQPTMSLGQNRVVWEAVVRIDLPDWPDHEETFEVRVAP